MLSSRSFKSKLIFKLFKLLYITVSSQCYYDQTKIGPLSSRPFMSICQITFDVQKQTYVVCENLLKLAKQFYRSLPNIAQTDGRADRKTVGLPEDQKIFTRYFLHINRQTFRTINYYLLLNLRQRQYGVKLQQTTS